jgi:membrane associated rhomboid family serine protease
MSSSWSFLLFLFVPLPIGTDRRRKHVPWVTITLIVINVLVFLFTQSYLHLHPGVDLYGEYGFQPASPSLLHLFFSLFLHVSVPHLFWNMAFLWLFGPHVEDALGPVSYLALYFGGGVAAGALHTAIKWLIPAQRVLLNSPLVGASGAISAVLAPFAVRYHRAQIRLLWLPGLLARSDWAQMEVPALWGLGLWLLQTLAGAVMAILKPGSGDVAYWAHLGGFAFGLIASELGGLLREGRQEYLLQEARTLTTRGQHRAAADKYQAFLGREPGNLPVRLEMVRLLASFVPEEAGNALRTGLRLAQAAERWPDAVQICAEADALGLALSLPSRDCLRLAAAAEENGQNAVSVSLLQRLLSEASDTPEEEMARLRLGQNLMRSDPQIARQVLTDFLAKYPHSAWADRARALLQQLGPDQEQREN